MISPPSGAVIWLIMRIKEVLPAPFGPKRPKILPFSTVKETLSSALWLAYSFTIFFMSNMGNVYPFDAKELLSLHWSLKKILFKILFHPFKKTLFGFSRLRLDVGRRSQAFQLVAL